MSIIYQRIMDLCTERHINKTILERECGFSQNSINKWQSRSYPAADKLIKVADYFGVSVDYLLGREKSMQESALPIQRTNTLPFTDDELNIIMENKEGTKYFEQIISKLDTQQKIYVLSWIVGYAQSQGIKIEF